MDFVHAPSTMVVLDDTNRVIEVGLPKEETKLTNASILVDNKSNNDNNTGNAMDIAGEEDDGNTEDGEPDDDEYVDEAIAAERQEMLVRRKQPWRYNANYLDVLEENEAGIATTLSPVMERCYFILIDLMRNPSFVTFSYPVDAIAIPQYYTSISQPLCLLDVRRGILKGQYEKNISGFYADILMILENASTYNPENTPIQ
jgi:hypothetical protein